VFQTPHYPVNFVGVRRPPLEPWGDLLEAAMMDIDSTCGISVTDLDLDGNINGVAEHR
jgi:hypothetical protein